MTTRGGSGKAWAAAHLFQTKGEPVIEERPSDGAVGGDEFGGWLGRLRLGESRREGSLDVVPLLLDGDGAPPAVVLSRQAVESGLLEIVERGEGVVQELVAWNKGERPVAILEGDTLVGCKQNRVVAHSVIVAPGTPLGLPVGCMERGRWSHATRRFAVGDMKMAPGVRRRAQQDVMASSRAHGEKRLDQSRLWSDVERELAATRTVSSTSDYYEIVERQGGEARQRARELAPVAGQVGVIVLADGALVGLEATGHHGLWSQLSPPTLASYLMGLHRGSEPSSHGRADAGEWLSRVQSAPVRTTPGLGLGQDLAVEGPGFAGVGLALGSFPVHLAVFPS